MKKIIQESKKGGARLGAGRPEGRTKTRTTISVDTEVMDAAAKKWDGNFSALVEKLLRSYIQ